MLFSKPSELFEANQEFSNLISQISDLNDQIEDWLDLDEEDEMSLENFRFDIAESEKKIKKIIDKMQPYFDT